MCIRDRPLFEVVDILRQAEDRHDLTRHRDVEAVLPGHSVDFSPEADVDKPQRAVVDVEAALEHNAAGVNPQLVALLEMVVNEGAEQVVRRCDGVHVTGKVQVDVLDVYKRQVCNSAEFSVMSYEAIKGFWLICNKLDM